MKRGTICTVIMAIAAMLTIGCAPKAKTPATTALIHPLDGLEQPVYYAATQPLTDGHKGELAVIMIQGWHGGVQFLDEQKALQEALGEGVYVLSPMYPRREMMEHFEIELDGRAIWNESWPLDLTKPGVPDDDWRGGGDANGTTLSSFDVIDTLFERLSDRKLFPNLKKIALVGFSAGGQFVGRYVAVGKGKVGEGITLEYAAMAPSTYLLPNAEDIWHYGLKGRPRYCRDISVEQIMENLRTRRCLHACGSEDTHEKSLDRTATAMRQGENRYVRFQNFRTRVESDARWAAATLFHTFEGLSHRAAGAYADPFFVEYVTTIKR